MLEFDLRRRHPGSHRELQAAGSYASGAFVCLVGPSGAGKTSLLRLLAGLDRPDAGFLRVHGEVWFDADQGIRRSPQQRSVGVVFQDYALFPNLDVLDNVAYALPSGERDWARQLLRRFGLADFAQRDVRTLSGGQKQRVALARAIARRPRLLLFDEPLSALDGALRRQLQADLADLHRELGLISVWVTHDIGEVFRLASDVLSLEDGRVVARGSPRQVYLQTPLGGHLQLQAQVLEVAAQDVVYVVSLAVGGDIVQILASADDVAGLEVGAWVALSAKALGPAHGSVAKAYALNN